MSLDILNLLSTGLDKLIPDAAQRQELKLKAMALQQNGEFREMETAMSAIVAEAQSSDKWTSRARPAFLVDFRRVFDEAHTPPRTGVG